MTPLRFTVKNGPNRYYLVVQFGLIPTLMHANMNQMSLASQFEEPALMSFCIEDILAYEPDEFQRAERICYQLNRFKVRNSEDWELLAVKLVADALEGK